MEVRALSGEPGIVYCVHEVTRCHGCGGVELRCLWERATRRRAVCSLLVCPFCFLTHKVFRRRPHEGSQRAGSL